MSKPKTTTGTTTGFWTASEGDVVFEPSEAPTVVLSKLRLNRGNGERAVGFVQDSLALMMRRNGGTITGSYLDELLGDVDRYYAPERIRTLSLRPIADDAVSVIDIGRNSIQQRKWGNAIVYRLDSLSEEAGVDFTPKATINDLKLKAANNQAATAVIAQLEDYLRTVFGSGGVAYKKNIIRPLTLRIRRAIIDDTPEQEEPQQAVPFKETYQGFVAFYKSGNKCDRVLIALARNSIESMVNLQIAVRDHKIDELESRLKDLEGILAELDN
jgi:hypothetical protein